MKTLSFISLSLETLTLFKISFPVGQMVAYRVSNAKV